MKGKIGDKQRLLHILGAITEIESYIKDKDLQDFISDSMMRFASVKQIEIIGEAANYISEETKDRFSEIQWRQIIGLRHILVHEYFGIDAHLIWQIILTDMSKLKEAVELVIDSLQNNQ